LWWARERPGLGVQTTGGGRAESCFAGSREGAIRSEFFRHKPAFELKYRNRAAEIVRKTRPVQSVFDVCNEYTADWFVNDLEEPYTTPKDQPFLWMGRLRVTGGRTNVWGE